MNVKEIDMDVLSDCVAMLERVGATIDAQGRLVDADGTPLTVSTGVTHYIRFKDERGRPRSLRANAVVRQWKIGDVQPFSTFFYADGNNSNLSVENIVMRKTLAKPKPKSNPQQKTKKEKAAAAIRAEASHCHIPWRVCLTERQLNVLRVCFESGDQLWYAFRLPGFGRYTQEEKEDAERLYELWNLRKDNLTKAAAAKAKGIDTEAEKKE